MAKFRYKDVEWNILQDNAFKEIKRLLTEAPVLNYFFPKKIDQLSSTCDANSEDLGAALLEEGKPFVYASRPLTDVEARYADIENEILATVFLLDNWHQFVYDRNVNFAL